MSRLRLGTRGSALALAQARWVADRLPDAVSIVAIATAGDLRRDDPGDKSRWTGALERALLAGEIDLAVHSAKDVPGELAEGTGIVAVPPRADPRDVLVGAASLATVPRHDLPVGAAVLDALPQGARVGTSALRRRAQLLAVRPDLDVVELRGNVDTRLRRLAAGESDALVLAAAGLARLGRADVTATPLEGEVFVPAPGQGCLLVQARAGDAAAEAAIAAADRRLSDAAARAALDAERDVAARLGASCHTAIGVHAAYTQAGVVPADIAGLPDRTAREGVVLRGFAGLPDGSEWLVDELAGIDVAALAAELADRMLAAGAADLLARAEAPA